MDQEEYEWNNNNRRKGNSNMSGQIPAFGDWENVNELPITQYFECARQAGLLRYSSSSGECDPPYSKHSPPPKLVKGRERRGVKESRKQGKVVDVMDLPPATRQSTVHDVTKHHHHQRQHQNDAVSGARRAPKAVDEDLYKIPPHLLHSSKRKKRLGFISRCLVPPCAV